MLRRRRRRSSFSRRSSPNTRYIMIGAAAVVFVGLFIFFIGQADRLAPEPREIRVELPDAFKD
jgi:cell division protein FtsN